MKVLTINKNKLVEAVLDPAVQEAKMDAWANGTRGANIKSMSDDKLKMNYDICTKKGYTKQAIELKAEAKIRGLSWAVPAAGTTKLLTVADEYFSIVYPDLKYSSVDRVKLIVDYWNTEALVAALMLAMALKDTAKANIVLEKLLSKGYTKADIRDVINRTLTDGAGQEIADLITVDEPLPWNKFEFVFEKKFGINGPMSRGASYPPIDKFQINEENIPDNIRAKNFSFSNPRDNEIELDWETQEPFEHEDFIKGFEEAKRAIIEIAKDCGYDQEISLMVNMYDRDGINGEAKQQTITKMELTESLNEWLSREAMIDEIKQLGYNYNFDKYSDGQLWNILKWARNKQANSKPALSVVKKPIPEYCDECGLPLDADGLCPVCDLGKHESLEEDIEKHNELNPKLFENNKLKPEVREKIKLITEEFLNRLKEDEISIDVQDIILVGSNCSYNYTKDSDLDLHIVANNIEAPENLYEKIYSAYRSIFNKNIEIDFYGIPVEIYVQTENTPMNSNGIYSVMNDSWIKEPVQEDIPEIDQEAFNKEFKVWEDRYNKIINSSEKELK